MTMAKFILALAMVAPSMGTGAFGSLWLLDLCNQPEVWDGQQLFQAEHPAYGRNNYVMIASHHSQHWFEVYALYAADAIDDVSDIYCRCHRGGRILQFIGHFSYLLIMAKLLPYLGRGLVPWHETIVQSNDYEGEVGCRVTCRSYLEPWIWWLRVGAETSIDAGARLFKNFMYSAASFLCGQRLQLCGLATLLSGVWYSR